MSYHNCHNVLKVCVANCQYRSAYIIVSSIGNGNSVLRSVHRTQLLLLLKNNQNIAYMYTFITQALAMHFAECGLVQVSN